MDKVLEDIFTKQRRNFMGISLVLLTLRVVGAEIQSIRSLGVSISIEKPHFLIIFFWCLWIYFFIRYYQSYKEYGKRLYDKSYQDSMLTILKEKMRGLYDGLGYRMDLDSKSITLRMIVTRGKKDVRLKDNRLKFSEDGSIYVLNYHDVNEPKKVIHNSDENIYVHKEMNEQRPAGRLLKVNLLNEFSFKDARFLARKPVKRVQTPEKVRSNEYWEKIKYIHIEIIAKLPQADNEYYSIEHTVFSKNYSLTDYIKLQANMFRMLFVNTTCYFEYKLPFIVGLVPLYYYLYLYLVPYLQESLFYMKLMF